MDESADLVELLEAYSPSGVEGPGTAAFEKIAHRLGYSVEIDEVGNGIASLGSGRPQILFLGHVDTVPGELQVRRDEHRVYGRGACDAKGPLVAALHAGAASGAQGEFVVVAAVGEETDSRGTRYLFDRRRPDAVIAGEPNGWDGIGTGYKGDLRLRATFDGARRHLSSPEANTTERALDWTAEIRALLSGASAPTGRFETLTGRIASFRSSESGDRESVEVVVDLRLPPGISTRAVRERLPSPTPPCHIDTIAEIEPFVSGRNDPVVRALVEAIRAEGSTPTLWRKGGTSDLNLVAPVWKVGGAVYGPGDAHLDHTDRESLEIDELRRAIAVLRRAVTTLRSGATLRVPESGGGETRHFVVRGPPD